MKLRWPYRRQPLNIENIIVGLGNPGPAYAGNRHNAGFMCLSLLAKNIGVSFDQKEGLARTAHGVIDTSPVLLARPQTYMNLSGQAVIKLVSKYSLAPANLIVIHDDLDLRLGQIRIRQGGHSGGHRGIASIISELGSEDFIRVRLGIGRPVPESPGGEHTAIVDFVLEDFSDTERKIITEATARVAEAVRDIITAGLETAMNFFNRTTSDQATLHSLYK